MKGWPQTVWQYVRWAVQYPRLRGPLLCSLWEEARYQGRWWPIQEDVAAVCGDVHRGFVRTLNEYKGRLDE